MTRDARLWVLAGAVALLFGVACGGGGGDEGGPSGPVDLNDSYAVTIMNMTSTAEQTSSFAVQVPHFLVEREDAVVDLLESIRDTSDLEEGYNPRRLTGRTWPTGYTLVPDTIDDPGTGSLGWNDRDLSDDVNTGNDLRWGLGEFRPHADAEWMYDGGMSFQNLVANIEGSGTAMSVGFFDALGRRGGVRHDGMRILQMDVDDGSMTVTEENMLELAGGFAFQLQPQ